jgi:isopentenyl-diphosphate delta-isomerase
MSEIERRKNDHLDIVLAGEGRARVGTGLDAVVFEHCALPEMSLDDVDLSAQLFGRRLSAPLLISSMTGGPLRADSINIHLAQAAQHLGIAFAVGSQRVAVEGASACGLSRGLRAHAPSAVILANFGAAQLNAGWGLEHARRVVDMIAADALIIHLNALQEAVQPGGDRDWSGLVGRLEAVVRHVGVPVIVKEVGAGISGRVARRLADIGIAAVDVAGAGGTSWAAVESARARGRAARVAATFAGWGIPTAQAIADVRRTCPALTLIGSGGIKSGLDVARALRLGADLVGQAAGVLEAALASTEAVVEHFETISQELRIACFCTGSRTIAELKRAPLVQAPPGAEVDGHAG